MSIEINTDKGNELSIEVIINAPREAVWRCWTEIPLFKQWFCPKPWTVPEADFDLRPGGRMNNTMAGPNGERVENTGIWLDINPGYGGVFTDAFTEGFIPRETSFMTGFFTLEDLPGGKTKMVWGGRHPTLEGAKQHLEMGFEQGWSAGAAQLAELAESLSA